MLISVGTFGSKMLVFLMVRFYTDWLTPEEYGTADLITQTANLLLPFVSLGITDSVFRFAIDQPEERKDIFTEGLLVIMAGSLICASLSPLLKEFSALDGCHGLIPFFVAASCFHSLTAQYVRSTGKTTLYAVQGLIGTLLVIAFNILFLAKLRIGVAGYVLSIAFSDVLCTVLLAVREKMWRLLTLHPAGGLIRKMLRYSIPLIPASVFWWITGVSDRFMITYFLGKSANGIYTVACKVPTVLILLSGVFLEAWQYSAVREKEIERESYERFYSRIWEIFSSWMILACSAIILLSKIEIRILAEEEYFEAWRYLPVLSLAMLFSSFVTFLGSVYIVQKKSSLSFWTALAAAASNLALNFLLIPSRLGVQGAAIATLASYALVFTIRIVSVRDMIAFRFHGEKLLICFLLLGLQAAALVIGSRGSVVIQVFCFAALAGLSGRTCVISLEKTLRTARGISMKYRQKGERK